MRRKLSKLARSIALLLALFPAGGFSLGSDPERVEVGDTGTFYIPVGNHGASKKIISNARATVSGVPAWLDIESTSFLGPVDIYPGESLTYTVNFTINSFYNFANPNAEVVVRCVSDSPSFVPSNLNWSFNTTNGFKTAQGKSADDSGIAYDVYRFPDILPPNTYLNYDGLFYLDAQENVFVSTYTSISFEGTDAYEIDTEIVGVSLTGHKIDSIPASFDALDFSTVPVVLPVGGHALYYASRDNAGNTEVIRSSTVYVDGGLPESSAVLAGVPGRYDWYISSVTVVLTASDTMSGIGNIYYRLEGAGESGADMNYGSPLRVPGKIV